MEFRVLGPLTAVTGNVHISLGGSRRRTVLATLLLNVGRVVSTDRLSAAIWGENPPVTARNQVAICVSGLRREFAAAGVAHDPIVTASSGYLLRLAEDDRFDIKEVEVSLRQARTARMAGNLEKASEQLSSALTVWRGDPLTGVEGELVRAESERLGEWRLAILEEFFEVELELSRDLQIVGELVALVAAYPLRERLRGLLMLAQSRAGRRAEALAVYQEGYRLSIERLGLEPGAELAELHEAILRGETGQRQGRLAVERAAPESSPAVPAQLPPDVTGFVARDEEIARLDELLDTKTGAGRPFVAVITGMGGVGKSGLAVHWSHRVASRFPDGQIFVDLNGFSETGPPVSPFDVLDTLLRALNVTRQHPLATLEERAALFRSVLAGRKLLLVLDNARDSSQVRPLLPGAPGCAVLVTSRGQLAGLITLEGATPLRLDVLPPEQGVNVLACIAGEQRVHADPEGARRLSELCGGLVLALRVAAARLAVRPSWTSADLVARLTDESRRLDELSQGEVDLRTKFILSYRDLAPQVAIMFRRLALLDVAEFGPWLGVALLEVDPDRAQDLIEQLVDAQLLELSQPRSGGQARYRFHDLMRLYARERVMAEESEQERNAALRRALGCWLGLVEAAHARLLGGDFAVLHGTAERYRLPSTVIDRLMPDPIEWFEAERPHLLAVIGQAAGAGGRALCWDLAMTSATFFESRSYFDDWRSTHELALAAARRDADARGEAAMIYGLGSLELFRQRYDDAERLLLQARRMFEEQGEEHGSALALRNLALLDRIAGRFELALERYERAEEMLRAAGDRAAQAHVLASTAQVLLEKGSYGEADHLLRAAVSTFEDIGYQRGLAQALYRFGEVLLRTQRIDAARQTLEKALETVRQLRDVVGESYVLRVLGETYAQQGRTDEAEKALLTSREIALRVGEQFVVGVTSLALGNLHFGTGNAASARESLTLAARIFEELGARIWHVRALEALAATEAMLNNDQGAHELWARAAALLKEES
ncbi:AfsR/SARP family transcriptional regulator [Nonomuraea soli]|uniref:DNA-binding SARP family transcriptional activator/tetratricopeptide (TPR) repeat protein n=1 Tax=Nonomuraea soli TaxID=1032476 RepID=A0A7W0CHY1_9ACTN|nr:BTAD domain-containing putative transcriptional regulator [Nonomuraea soli]MBA2891453.1 DNA-binding SARP family transcriptional activator/tetratricopeptide (TPR) repeat protein [Nonomuraea soli]